MLALLCIFISNSRSCTDISRALLKTCSLSSLRSTTISTYQCISYRGTHLFRCFDINFQLHLYLHCSGHLLNVIFALPHIRASPLQLHQTSLQSMHARHSPYYTHSCQYIVPFHRTELLTCSHTSTPTPHCFCHCSFRLAHLLSLQHNYLFCRYLLYRLVDFLYSTIISSADISCTDSLPCLTTLLTITPAPPIQS